MSEKSSTFVIEKEEKSNRKQPTKNGRANRKKQAQSTMKHSIETNLEDKCYDYIQIYEVRYTDENGNRRIWMRYMSEERADETCRMLRKKNDKKYRNAYIMQELVLV